METSYWLLKLIPVPPPVTTLLDEFFNVSSLFPPFLLISYLLQFGFWSHQSALLKSAIWTFLMEQWMGIPCQGRGHAFDPWSGKIPPSAEQLKPICHNC